MGDRNELRRRSCLAAFPAHESGLMHTFAKFVVTYARGGRVELGDLLVVDGVDGVGPVLDCLRDLRIVRLRLRPGWSSWRTRAAATSSSRRKRDSRSSRSCICPTRAVLGDVAHGGRITSTSSCNQ
jgi:hypothetical protein